MYETCPSYLPRGGTNAVAEAGTRIHEAAEKEDPSLLTDEVERSLAEWALAFVDHVRREKDASSNLLASHKEVFLEMDFDSVGTYGTCDVLDLYKDGTGVLVDYKFGFGKVADAEENSQIQAYAYGAFQKFPEINELASYLVSPRRQEISYATYTRDDMPRIRLRLSTIIARAKQSSGSIFNPTEGVCDYCANQGKCQALADKALVVAQKSGFPVPQSLSYDGSPKEKGQILKLANLLEGWAGEAKKELLRQSLEEGAEVTGYRLDQRRTPRAIDNPLVGYDSVKDLVSIEEYLLACKSVSVAELEKFVAERAPRGHKAEAKQHLEDVLKQSGALREEGTIHLLKPIRA
jgi:RecB family exonuclease